jgi:hypothetical protein
MQVRGVRARLRCRRRLDAVHTPFRTRVQDRHEGVLPNPVQLKFDRTTVTFIQCYTMFVTTY